MAAPAGSLGRQNDASDRCPKANADGTGYDHAAGIADDAKVETHVMI
jgi:hypothetical protein